MKRRYKLILLFFISFLLVFFIYVFFKKEEKIYVAIGDSLNYNNLSTYNYASYIKYYLKDNTKYYEYLSDYTFTEEIINDLSTNKNNINYYIKNASIVTLSLGTYELNNYKNINEEVIIDYLTNIYTVINKIAKLNDNIYVINVYDTNYELVNKKIKEYCYNAGINYITTKDIGSKYVYMSGDKTYLNYIGHNKLAKIIVNNTDKLN